jgi:endoglucanase
MYLWRCGCAVADTFGGAVYSHAACHLNDAYLKYIDSTSNKKASLKGWHDAGDFNKYTVNAGITIGMLLKGWEMFGAAIQTVALNIPETGGKFPDYLAEVKWELDWLLTMQFPNGTVSHKVSTIDFCDFIMPERETQTRYFVPWGSAATADFAAMMAMASRVFLPYDSLFSDTCLKAAKKSYDFLAANLDNHNADQSAFSTGAYSTTDKDDRLWAAAELWESTGDAKYLIDFETRAAAFVRKIDIDWDWSNVKNLGMFTYLLSKRTEKSQSMGQTAKNELLLAADTMVLRRSGHGYGRAMDTTYYWGCNGSVARQTMVLQIANSLSPKKDYVATALDAINHIFGKNYYCRSFVTGLGLNPPLHPHDRRSVADNVTAPWPGYLVGGGWPGAKGWVDNDTNYRTNEIAINWQGALIYALAGFIGPGANISIKNSVVQAAPKRRFHTVVFGISGVEVPKGKISVFDCKGNLVKNFTSREKQFLSEKTLGLRRGVYFMKQERK